MKIESIQEVRWALARNFDYGWYFLGPYCWPADCWANRRRDQVSIITFRTRKLAKEARKICCYPDARPVKIRMTIEAIG